MAKKRGKQFTGSFHWSKDVLYLKWKDAQSKLEKIRRLVYGKKTDISAGAGGGWITINKNVEILKRVQEVFEDGNKLSDKYILKLKEVK